MTKGLEEVVHNATSARFDARGVAKLYDLTLVDIAKAIGKSEDTVRKNPDSSPIQEKLGILVDSFARLLDLMQHDEQAVRRWLHRPNRGLDVERPVVLLQNGGAWRVSFDGSTDGDRGLRLVVVLDESLVEAVPEVGAASFVGRLRNALYLRSTPTNCA